MAEDIQLQIFNELKNLSTRLKTLENQGPPTAEYPKQDTDRPWSHPHKPPPEMESSGGGRTIPEVQQGVRTEKTPAPQNQPIWTRQNPPTPSPLSNTSLGATHGTTTTKGRILPLLGINTRMDPTRQPVGHRGTIPSLMGGERIPPRNTVPKTTYGTGPPKKDYRTPSLRDHNNSRTMVTLLQIDRAQENWAKLPPTVERKMDDLYDDIHPPKPTSQLKEILKNEKKSGQR